MYTRLMLWGLLHESSVNVKQENLQETKYYFIVSDTEIDRYSLLTYKYRYSLAKRRNINEHATDKISILDEYREKLKIQKLQNIKVSMASEVKFNKSVAFTKQKNKAVLSNYILVFSFVMYSCTFLKYSCTCAVTSRCGVYGSIFVI